MALLSQERVTLSHHTNTDPVRTYNIKVSETAQFSWASNNFEDSSITFPSQSYIGNVE